VTEHELRQQVLLLQREIASAFQELNRIWAAYVRPNAAEAKLYVSAPRRGSRIDLTSALSTEQADRLDLSSPTGAFEYGRAYMAYWGDVIRRKQRRLTSVRNALQKVREEETRRALPGQQWLDLFRSLVLDTRKGG
jgi:hypothetical protein